MPSSDTPADSELAIPGLLNSSDNLCYLNSALQTLASSRSVRAAVRGSLELFHGCTASSRSVLPRTAQPDLLQALADLLQKLQPCASGEQAALSSGAVAIALRYAQHLSNHSH